MNVFAGGTLLQHVEGHAGPAYGTGPALTHPLRVVPGTKLARILFPSNVGGGVVTVNSYHHQAVRQADLAPGFVACGLSPSRGGRAGRGVRGPDGAVPRWASRATPSARTPRRASSSGCSRSSSTPAGDPPAAAEVASLAERSALLVVRRSRSVSGLRLEHPAFPLANAWPVGTGGVPGGDRIVRWLARRSKPARSAAGTLRSIGRRFGWHAGSFRWTAFGADWNAGQSTGGPRSREP